MIATYEYDAWGNLLSIKNEYNVDITNSTGYFANINPIRYRGYYCDVETGFYYLQSRYYDPANCRFISADDPTVVTDPSTVTDKNLFAYCDNDPITRRDDGGQFWDTVFDVVSLVGSVAEVVANPCSVGAWVSVVGDAVDLIPFVSGVGEVTRLARVTNNTLEVVDTVHDTAKALDKTGDAVETGWKVGDDISNLTRKGDVPSWNTVRNRYWKNEAYYNESAYTAKNLERMRQGKAPQFNYKGNLRSAELHHIVPRRSGGSNVYSNLLPVTPLEHSLIDSYRYIK